MPEKLAFNVDPVWFLMTALKLRVENRYNQNEDIPKSTRFAIIDVVHELTEEKLESLLEQYMNDTGATEIDMEGASNGPVCTYLEKALLISDDFNQKKFNHQLRHSDGLGVADLKNQTFTPCDYAEHWDALRTILVRDHGAYGTLFAHQMDGDHIEEIDGITVPVLDAYILEQFKFVGASDFTTQRLNSIHKREL